MSSPDVGVMPRLNRHWASVEQDGDGFEQEDDRNRGAEGALCPFPRLSFEAAKPPRYSGYESSNHSLSRVVQVSQWIVYDDLITAQA